MPGAVPGELPVHRREEGRATEDSGDRRADATGRDRLLHELEGQDGEQHAAAERHDRRDGPVREPEEVARGSAEEEAGARGEAQEGRLRPGGDQRAHRSSHIAIVAFGPVFRCFMTRSGVPGIDRVASLGAGWPPPGRIRDKG